MNDENQQSMKSTTPPNDAAKDAEADFFRSVEDVLKKNRVGLLLRPTGRDDLFILTAVEGGDALGWRDSSGRRTNRIIIRLGRDGVWRRPLTACRYNGSKF